MSSQQARPRVAIAGASGFIGQALCRALSHHYQITALTRSPTRASLQDEQVLWQWCDLWSRKDMLAGLAGAEYAVYLVHSMLPSSRLTQAHSADMDLLVADNFARAARQHGIRQILYLGSLYAEGDKLSPRLRSPSEVEQTLSSHGVPVTTVQAGLVVGPGGSTVRLLTALARCRWLAVPDWANARHQPVALVDTIKALVHCLGNEACFGQRYQIGAGQVYTLRELLNLTARVLGHDSPGHGRALSPRTYRWVARWLSGAYPELVAQFVDGLQVDQVATRNILPEWLGHAPQRFEEALRTALNPQDHQLLPSPRAEIRHGDDAAMRRASRVRSIQRIPLPAGRDAYWLADHYFHWLPGAVAFFVNCHQEPDRSWRIALRWPSVTLLHLRFRESHSAADRQMFFIDGGILARVGGERQGRFEFRDVLGGRYTLAAIHDFAPLLPWRFYSLTQALAHAWVMRTYQRRLARLAGAGKLHPPPSDGANTE